MRKPLVLLALLVCTCVLPAIPVHAQNEPPVYHFTVSPAYVPVHIVITYAYTTNWTNVAVYSTNQSANSLLKNDNPPSSSVTFQTGSVDVFNFGFTVYYPYAQNQTVTVQVFQGSMQVEGGGEMPISGDSFSMTFTVVTSNEPHYPSPEDIFNMWTGQYPTRGDFLAWQQLMANQNGIINSNVSVQYFVLGFIAVVFLFGEALRVWKRKPRES